MKRILSLILVAVLLIGIYFPSTVVYAKSPNAAPDAISLWTLPDDATINGTYAADYEKNTICAVNGSLFLRNYFEKTETDLGIKGTALAIYHDYLIVSENTGMNHFIRSYDLATYTLVSSIEIARTIDIFCIANNRVYYISDGAVLSQAINNPKDTVTIYSGADASSVSVYDENRICYVLDASPEKCETLEDGHCECEEKKDVAFLYDIISERISNASECVKDDSLPVRGAYGSSSNYTTTVGGTTLPLSQYPEGSYATINGSACASHSTSTANCLRYYTDPNGRTVDTYGWQCCGFARYVFYRCFGFVDWSGEGDFYEAVSNISKNSITENYVRSILGSTVLPGAHIRTNVGTNGYAHSLAFLGCDSTYVYTYECNSDGHCGVHNIKRTWAEMTDYLKNTKNGIAYIDMPTDYPSTLSIEPGIYTIHSARDDNMVFDITGDSTESLANIQLYESLNNDVQKFKILKEGDYYVIQSVYSGHWLDVASPFTSRSNVQLYYTNENTEEKWTFEDAGNGYVYIKNYHGCYADIAGDNAVNSANIQVYDSKESDSQRWRLAMEPIGIPQNVKAGQKAADVVGVSWDPVEFATSYDVYLIQAPWGWEDIKYSVHVSSDYHYAELDGVEPGYYNAFVIARPNENSMQSQAIPVSVEEVGIPQNIAIGRPGANKIGVSWDEVPFATSYDVYMVQAPWGWDDIKYSVKVSSDYHYAEIDGIAEGEYRVFVIARPNDDYSHQSEWRLVNIKSNYTVTFDPSPGSCSQTNKTVAYGQTYGQLPTPTRNGFSFDGWYTSASAGEKVTADTVVKLFLDQMLYAHWTDLCADGHDYSYAVTTAPTTSATGTLTGTCSRCGTTTTVTLPKLNTTDYNYTVAKAATCTATGTGRYTWKTTTYGTFYFDVTIPKTAHNYQTSVTPPTCTEQGYTTHTCTVCGDSYKDNYTAALGHNYSYAVTKAPTTSATGTLIGTCSRCGTTTTVTLPKLNTTDYNYTVVKAATCTATGTGRYTWKTTTYGTFYFDVTIPKTAHNYQTTVTPPTCTEQGYATHTCTVCGDSYKDSYTAALGHSYSYAVTTAPTTSITGTLTGTCSRCNGTTTVALPKLTTTDYNYTVTKAATCTATGTGRYTWKTTTYGTFYFDVTLPKIAHNYQTTVTPPTCTAQGYTTHTCTVCGDSYKDSYTAALGHSYSYAVTSAPTTSITGTLTGTCSRCKGTTTVTLPKLNTTDYNYTVVKAATCTATGTGRYTWKTTTYGTFYFDVSIPKAAHNYQTTVTPPTCTEQGYTSHTCSVCGNTFNDTYTDALGHDFVNGVCSRCGAIDPDYVADAELTINGTPMTAAPGSTITVPVMISGDVGFAGFTLSISASDGLTLKKIEKGALLREADGMFTPNVAQGVVNWTSSSNTNGNGELLILTYDVSETVEDESELTISLGLKDGKPTNFGNEDEQPVSVAFESIIVTVQSVILGDVNGDGEVDAIDSIRLARYLVDLVDLTEQQRKAADVNNDGDVTATDAIRLSKYLVGLVGTLNVPATTGQRSPRRVPLRTAGTAEIAVGEVTAIAGDTVKIPVTISNNPGFAGYTMVITAADGLTLTNIEKGTLLREADGMFTKNVAQGSVNWTSTENITADGELMLLTFVVSDAAEAGDYSVVLELKDGNESNFANANEAAIYVGFASGDIILEPIPFTDMPDEKHWAYDAIKWAVARKITSGTTETTFSPNAGCTRAQVVTFLWRAAGSPEPISTNNPFTDVEADAYYYKAVLWAAESKITAGTSTTTFSPDATCTRGQIVTFLWRFEGEPTASTTNDPFTDVNTGAYYEKAVLWAAETGVTAGTSATTFSPETTCTRAQIVTFLYRDLAKQP